MQKHEISPDQLTIDIFNAWSTRWFLLTAGDTSTEHFNTMKVDRGSLGVMWAKPFVQVVVRPSRYTHDLMEEDDTFTLSTFSNNYKEALTICGTKSG